MLNEIEHYPLHLFFIHLSVANSQTRLRYQAFDERCNRFDGFHPVVYEKSLSATAKFKFNCRFDNVLRKLNDLSLDRQPIAWRSFNQGHITQSAERHVERTRNGCSRKRQYVNALLEMFQSFFVSHAKALLFVNNNNAELLEFNVFRQQAMRADNYVYVA